MKWLSPSAIPTQEHILFVLLTELINLKNQNIHCKSVAEDRDRNPEEDEDFSVPDLESSDLPVEYQNKEVTPGETPLAKFANWAAQHKPLQDEASKELLEELTQVNHAGGD